ncbi:DUF4037 domain-containing protein [Anaerococcus tetradius]|uniref:DUF4037 domain-containing protein n=1 Tax=Anaerococcus tetradius TaxID=33036 RepID=UPI0023F1578A|nr:DUF4037 domain-containing protein [Anaerococcus tetradius]
MNGIDLSKKYFYDIAYPIFKKNCPEILDISSIGLVGEGSECFGLDDDISKDHDFGPGFCIWLSEDDVKIYKNRIESVLKKLPKEFLGYKRIDSQITDKRVGLFSVEDFYEKYTSVRKFPINDIDFLKIPESFLATVTNGEIFLDNCKLFSAYRKYLLDFYPEDVIRKKLAAYLFQMAQAGQYNLKRSLDRSDISATFFAKAEFMEALFGVLFLFAKVYMPYYKLRYKRLVQINYYPSQLFEDMNKFILANGKKDLLYLSEKLSNYVKDILKYRSITRSNDDFLLTHAIEVQNSIENPQIRAINLVKGN